VAQQQAPQQVEAARGAFGQRTEGGAEPAPQNHAERRAQERKGR
jgi:preprotein translocase subunit SecA